MSTLIDDLTKLPDYKKIDGKWYIAKPYDWQICSIETLFIVVRKRIEEAFEVLTGKAIAVHFKEK